MSAALEPPEQPEVRSLIAELDAYQDSLYPPEARYALDMASLTMPNVLFAVARDRNRLAIGCGAIVLSGRTGELKRMYVRTGHRGQGVAQQVLACLERAAAERGCQTVLLETGPYQPEALGFYAKHGYARRGPFGSYPEHPLSVFMQKRLQASS